HGRTRSHLIRAPGEAVRAGAIEVISLSRGWEGSRGERTVVGANAKRQAPVTSTRMGASPPAGVMPERAYRMPLGFRVRSHNRSLTRPAEFMAAKPEVLSAGGTSVSVGPDPGGGTGSRGPVVSRPGPTPSPCRPWAWRNS